MSGSMYAAISGLQAEQKLLGTVAQNIANVSTVGYKSSSVNFAQALQQTLSGASAPTATMGGTNPIQVSAGGAVNVAGISVNMGEGTLTTTGVNTNLAIQGHGFFIVQTSQGGRAYTRAGDFSLDRNGNLVNPEGNLVLGWNATNVANKTLSKGTLSPITVTPGLTSPPLATDQAQTPLTVSGNLNSQRLGTTSSTNPTTPVTLYNSLGVPQSVTLTFTPSTSSTSNSWTVSYQGPNNTSGTLGTIAFNASGAYSSFTPSGTTNGVITIPGTNGANTLNVNVANAFTQMTSAAMSSNVTATAGGYGPGTLQNYTIGATGQITGTFSNGQKMVLGQIALAQFNNPGGLTNIGNSLWQSSPNSGTSAVGTANSGGLGSIGAGMLEGSNVNLANEFVNMVQAQQGYQANAKVISVAQALGTALTNMIAP